MSTGSGTGISRSAMLRSGIAAASIAALPRLARAQSLRKVTFTQAWLPDGSNLFIYAAKNLGFFRKRGIDLTISRGYGSVAASEAVGADKFDFGMTAVTAGIQQTAQGLPVTYFGVVGYDSTMGIAVLADSPIKTPKDLEGRKLGSTVTSGEYPFLPLYAKRAGFDLAKVQRVQLDAQVRNRALITRQVDAISAFAGSSIPSIAAQGIETRFFPYSAVGVNVYGLALVTQPKTATADPALSQAIFDASLEGLIYGLKDPDGALAAFARELPEVAMSPASKDQARIGFGMYALTALMPPAKAHGIGWQDPSMMASQTDLVMEYVVSKSAKRPNVASLYTNRFVRDTKLSDAEWSAALARFAPYKKYLGI